MAGDLHGSLTGDRWYLVIRGGLRLAVEFIEYESLK